MAHAGEDRASERGGLLGGDDDNGETAAWEKRPGRINARLGAWTPWLVPLVALLAGFVVGVLASSIVGSGHSRTSDASALARIFAPRVPVVFAPNSTFANATATDAETDAAWAGLIPAGRGFVRLTDGERSGSGNLSDTKVVSVFHQLHCVDMLRRSLAASVANPLEFSYLAPQLAHHWGHCLDYLRQALTCAANVTLETLQAATTATTAAGLAAVNGWSTTHLCRDFQGVADWAAANRATDDGGLID
ncbi:hypothetical protein B0T26DRAFT_258938 [Lasiosphaeria miniovina]|uniref:Uncharacterized protein n=1 Tax=Lasiosphaeria miniovina TaxID=1954250 RepID=A0AA40AWN1_9PEZI|nr:uncharacterized protein B0T26DRAFT_258938 [Lasiosphaeria miniovina]KAK0723342.1 hypothetical protein B0T26DRAFT_258938 [Lasiosphaeria miniovina]